MTNHIEYDPNTGELTIDGDLFPYELRCYPSIRRIYGWGGYRVRLEIFSDTVDIKPWADPDSFTGCAYTA